LLPDRVDPIDGHDDPDTVVGRLGGTPEAQADVGGCPILLTGVARAAGGYDVVPRVSPSPALGDDVVDVLGRTAAVLAFEVVSHEHGPAAERRPGPVRDLHEIVESNDAGGLDLEILRVEGDPIRMDDLGLALQREDERPTYSHDAERLVRRIQDKRSSQSALSI
jgi:hypothetical protein